MRHRCAQKKGEKKNKREEAEKWNLTHEGRNEEIKWEKNPNPNTGMRKCIELTYNCINYATNQTSWRAILVKTLQSELRTSTSWRHLRENHSSQWDSSSGDHERPNTKKKKLNVMAIHEETVRYLSHNQSGRLAKSLA